MNRIRPHFIHLGPEKTGSSWLHDMLEQHPDVDLPPLKEIRYFYERFISRTSFLRRLLGSHWVSQDYRMYLLERGGVYMRHPLSAWRSRSRLAWDLSYLFGRRSDRWFERLFPAGPHKVTGDFSPQTFDLDRRSIEAIAEGWPSTRVMLVVREPVEWTWSFTRMSLIKDRSPSAVPDESYLQFFAQCAASYPNRENIAKWRDHFGGRLKVLFFDELVATPDLFLADVCDFLSLPTAPIAGFEGAGRPRNEGRTLLLPDHLRRHLIDLYIGDVRKLAEDFGSHPARWLKDYEG